MDSYQLLLDIDTRVDKEVINFLLNIFIDDFIVNPVFVDNVPIKVKTYNTKLEDFGLYPESFVHCITRGSDHSRHRYFDRERGFRIHWVKKMLIDSEEKSFIKYFVYKEANRRERMYYWFEEKNHIVITEKISKDTWLITGFCIEKYKKQVYKRRYEEYNKNKAAFTVMRPTISFAHRGDDQLQN